MGRLIRLFALLIMLAAPAAAKAEWYEASSTHFRVYAEGSAESVRAFATRLERFDKGMRHLSSLPDEDLGPANRVTVYVLPGMDSIRRLARGGRNIAGFYVPRAGGSVAFVPRRMGGSGPFEVDSETILFHEYAHHFMIQNYAGPFPDWFMEGFAEFNSTARFDKDGGVGFGLPANHRAYGLVSDAALSVETLLASGERKLSREQMEATIYGRGWLLTHYLTFNEARKGQLAAYLAALSRGVPGTEAARSAFGDLRALDRELRSYVKRPKLSYVQIGAAALPIGPVTVRAVSPGEAAIMSLRMQSDRGVNAKEAKALVGDMRRAAGRFPADPVVQSALAEAEYDAGNLAEAEAAADRALAADPKNVQALLYRGMIAMERASEGKTSDAATWREVRRRLLAANAVDPDDPRPFILFYRSFLKQGIDPTRNAVTGLLRALELAPQDIGLRLMAARQYLIDGKGPEARAALVPVAFNPHSGATGKAIQAIIAKLDASGPAAALADWGALPEEESEEEPTGGGRDKATARVQTRLGLGC